MDNLMFEYNHIISKNFSNLSEAAKRDKVNYINAKPFPSIELNNFFNDDFLSKVHKEFPDLSKLNKSQNYQGKNEIKFAK